jgi:hypothetical protein
MTSEVSVQQATALVVKQAAPLPALCRLIVSQVSRTVEESLTAEFAMSAPLFREKFFNECHGTFKAEIGLYSDEVRVMIVHGEERCPNLEHRIISALAKKLSLAYLGPSVFDDCHRFILDRKAAGFDTVSSRWRQEEIWGPKGDAGPATVQCAVEIFSLTPTNAIPAPSSRVGTRIPTR